MASMNAGLSVGCGWDVKWTHGSGRVEGLGERRPRDGHGFEWQSYVWLILIQGVSSIIRTSILTSICLALALALFLQVLALLRRLLLPGVSSTMARHLCYRLWSKESVTSSYWSAHVSINSGGSWLYVNVRWRKWNRKRPVPSRLSKGHW